MKAGLEGLEWRDVLAAEDLRSVGFLDQGPEVGNVVDELRKDGEGEIRIGERPPGGEVGLGEALRHVQAAVGRQAFQQDVGEPLRLRASAGADVEHAYSSSSRRRRTILPSTVGRRS